MTRLLVTTVCRNTHHTEPSGYIYLIDPRQQRVLQRSAMIEPAFRPVDTNPRGGLRGSRGISIREDEIAIANASIVFRYDPQWRLKGILTHPAAAAIHDILYQGDGTLWLTGACNDLVFQFDLAGKMVRHYYLRKPGAVTTQLGWNPPVALRPEQIRRGEIDFRDPRSYAEETYNHAHVNSICALSENEVLVSMGLVIDRKFSTLLFIKKHLDQAGLWSRLLAVNRKLRSLFRMQKNVHSDLVIQPARGRSAVIRITPEQEPRVVITVKDTTVPSHSVQVLDDQTAVYLNTTTGEVIHFQIEAGSVITTTKVTDGFLRGALQLNADTLLMGSRSKLITFDLSTRRVTDTMSITQDPNESVYDIKILPDHYQKPPESFEQHFQDALGYRGAELLEQGRRIPPLEIVQDGSKKEAS
jgi:hypothetical protein